MHLGSVRVLEPVFCSCLDTLPAPSISPLCDLCLGHRHCPPCGFPLARETHGTMRDGRFPVQPQRLTEFPPRPGTLTMAVGAVEGQEPRWTRGNRPPCIATKTLTGSRSLWFLIRSGAPTLRHAKSLCQNLNSYADRFRVGRGSTDTWTVLVNATALIASQRASSGCASPQLERPAPRLILSLNSRQDIAC
jgi:hypothetical protein